MSDSFVSATLLLLLLCDPFGNIPTVAAMLRPLPKPRHRLIILRECAIAWLALLAFLYMGESVMRLLQLSQTSLGIAGGILLFLIALRMVFPQPKGVFGAPAVGEPFIVPLAIPLLAGPSAMAMVMLLATREPQRLATWAGALSVAMACTTVILLSSESLIQKLGERGTAALEKLMGLLLSAIAVEMLLAGIRGFVESL